MRAFFQIAILGAAGFAAIPQGDETVAAFRKFFPTFRNSWERVECVLSLEGIDSTEALEVLLPVLRDRDPQVRRAAIRVLGGISSEEAVSRMASLLKESRESKDPLLRAGLAAALGVGKRARALPNLLAASADKSSEVRAAVAEALGAIADRSAVEALGRLAGDREGAVRTAAADALGAIGDPAGEAPLLELLKDREWPVRAAAVTACGRVRSKAFVAPLIDALGESRAEYARLVDDAAKSLFAITGMDFGADPGPWKDWWGKFGEVFQVPSAEDLKRLAERRRERAAVYGARDTTTYHDIATPSKRLVFVLDTSGSMEDFVVDRERFKERGFTRFRKIDIVKEELARTIANLEPYVRFNLIAFATNVRPWRKALVPANVLNKKAAIDWAENLEPIGGASSEGLAGAGLLAAAGLTEGRTNSYGALLAALGVSGPDDPAIDQPAEADTVFFLSDGRPSVGMFVDPDDIRETIGLINRRRKIVLHVLAIGEFQKTWMERLALENGGQFVDLGR